MLVIIVTERISHLCVCNYFWIQLKKSVGTAIIATDISIGFALWTSVITFRTRVHIVKKRIVSFRWTSRLKHWLIVLVCFGIHISTHIHILWQCSLSWSRSSNHVSKTSHLTAAYGVNDGTRLIYMFVHTILLKIANN